MDKRRSKRAVIFSALCLALSLSGTAWAGSGPAIEKADVNMPEVSVSYRSTDQGGPDAYLGGEKLEPEGDPVLFSDSGIPASYSVLVDVSGSLSQERFADIKQSLQSFADSLRKDDRLVLYTFGDKVTKVLKGTESRDAAKKAIEGLENGDMTTALFDALTQAADEIGKEDDPGSIHQAIICISDGEDFADNTEDAKTTSDSISADGIPVYTIAVEKKSETEESRKGRSSFSSIATATGGIPWTVDQLPEGTDSIQENSVKNGLDGVMKSVLGTKQMRYTASTNRPSMSAEDLVLSFGDGTEATRSLLVTRHIPDTEAPGVSSVKATGENEITVTYSEPVLGADKAAAYQLSLDGKSIAVSQVVKSSDMENTYKLVTQDKLYNGTYSLEIGGVTDDSAEQNALSGYSKPTDLRVTELKDFDSTPPTVKSVKQSEPDGFEIVYSEEVKGADNNSNYSVTLTSKKGKERDIKVIQAKPDGKDKTKYRIVLEEPLVNGDYTVHFSQIKDASDEANPLTDKEKNVTVSGIKKEFSIKQFLRDWWPLVLTGVLAVVIIILLVFFRKIRKNRLQVVNGMVLSPENIDRKVGIDVDSASPAKDLEIWISSGKAQPRRVSYRLEGSMVFGRSRAESDIFCNDPTMSKQHFVVMIEPDGSLSVVDLQSTNKTLVNGIPVDSKMPLKPGDEIEAGNMHFQIGWK